MNRLAVTAAGAVLLASLSLSSVIASAGWIVTGAGAVAVVTIAGALTRRARLPAAVAATLLVLIALVPLLTRPGWADRSVALVILVITALSATGAWPLRGIAVLTSYLSALLLYLNMTFAHSASLGLLIPTDSSMSALARLWQAAFAEFRYAPPIPDLQPVSLVTAAGIGGVAIAVDLLAVRLRRPAVAGLPLLLLFSVPVASNLKVFGLPQMIIFAVSLTGYLALLSADGRERLRMWGRLVTFRYIQSADEPGSGPDTRELSASGRRIGLAAVCLAIVVPAILPTVRARDLFGTVSTGAGHGGSHSTGVSPLLRVQNLLEGKPQPVLTYTTTAKDPAEQYFQVYALNYDARQNDWPPPTYSGTRAPDGPKLPWAVPGVLASTPATKVTTTITISNSDTGEAILPMPYAPVRLDIGGSGWLELGGSLTVFDPAVTMPDLRYTVQSEEVSPPPADIPDYLGPPASIFTAYGTYNGPDFGQLRHIAVERTRGATTELQQARDLENWFRSGAFTYSLKPNLPATNWLLPFLTTDRRGFCSQFAQAFAILARTLGIPARVAIGYTAGTPGPGNTWRITTADAHAWPEVYFAGEGWLRFEPTPSGSRGQGTAEVPAYAGGGAGSAGRKQGAAPGGSSPNATGRLPGIRGRALTNRDAHLAGGGPFTPATRHVGSKTGFAIAVAIVLFLLIAWPALTRLLTRRRRWLTASGDAGVATAAWRELTDDLADFGLPCGPGETPRAVARRVTSEARLGETATAAISRLAAAEERARYARLPEPGTGLKAAVLTVRRAVAASVPRRQRVRARLLPASTVLAARHLLQRGSEMLNWLDSPWPAVRRRLRDVTARRAG